MQPLSIAPLAAVFFVICLSTIDANHQCYKYDNMKASERIHPNHATEHCDDQTVNKSNQLCYRATVMENGAATYVFGGCVLTSRCRQYGGPQQCRNTSLSDGTVAMQCCCSGFLCNTASTTTISTILLVSMIFIGRHLNDIWKI
jgi:hypothetical protein